MRKKDIYILLFIFAFGYLLRVMFLHSNILTFGYDQARDSVISQKIINGDLKIFGPPSSTPGLFHGVLYYYVLAIGYLFGKNPISAAYWIALVNSLSMFVVYYLTFLMTKKRLPAILAAFFYAISFEAVQYATWLSNPTIAIFTVPLLYLGLWAWVKEGKKWGMPLTAIGLGFSIQSEVFLLYHIVPVAIWIFSSKKDIKNSDIYKFIAILLATVSTMILAQLKFGLNETVNGLLSITGANSGPLAYADSVGDYLVLYLNQIGRIFAFNSYPGNIGYGGVFVIVLALFGIYKSKKWGAFLATWLFAHITVVTVGGSSTPFLMVGIGPAVSILLGIFIWELWQSKNKFIAIIVLLILVYGNISTIMTQNKKGSTLFAIQPDMLLAKQLSLIDDTYRIADGKEFSTNSLTSPLWINIVWAYLYNWHGNENYDYTPCYSGRDQVGELVVTALPKCETGLLDNHFTILEPMGGIPPKYLDEILDQENAISQLNNEKDYGELRLQVRNKI